MAELKTITINGVTYNIAGSGGGGGTSDYSELENKPKINGIELDGNKSSQDLKIEREISWKDYQALSKEEKCNGTVYYIPDPPGGSGGGSEDYERLKKSMMMFFDNPTGLETESIIGAGVSGEQKHFIDVSNNGALKYQWNTYGGAYMFLEITAGESEENCNDVLRPNAGGIDSKIFLVSDYNVVCFRFTVTNYNYNITVTKS